MTPEGRVKAEVKKQLKLLGAYQFWPVQTGMGVTTLDCLAILDGLPLAIETKAPGKKLTPRQEIVINAIRKSGGIALVIDSVDMAKRLHDHIAIARAESTGFTVRCALCGHAFRRST